MCASDLEENHHNARDLLDELAQWIDVVVFNVLQCPSGNPSPPLAQPGTDKPRALVAAETAVFEWETIEKALKIVCDRPARCEHHRCRRRKRCGRLEKNRDHAGRRARPPRR